VAEEPDPLVARAHALAEERFVTASGSGGTSAVAKVTLATLTAMRLLLGVGEAHLHPELDVGGAVQGREARLHVREGRPLIGLSGLAGIELDAARLRLHRPRRRQVG